MISTLIEKEKRITKLLVRLELITLNVLIITSAKF